MNDYAAGDEVEVWDADVRRWVAGKVQGFSPMPNGIGEIMVVDVDEPDPGPLAVNKVPSVYGIVDMGMVRRKR